MEYYLILWIGIGIAAATLMGNRLFASGLVDYQMLYGYVSRGWQNIPENRLWMGIRICAVRLAETAVLSVICRQKNRQIKKIGICLVLVCCGAVTGLSIVLLTWCRGLLGIFCCVASWMPQYLFYVCAWGIMIFPAVSGYEIRTGKYRIAAALFLAAGIMTEVWVNPFFLKFL